MIRLANENDAMRIARAFYEKHGFELTDSKKKHEQLGVYEVRYEKHV